MQPLEPRLMLEGTSYVVDSLGGIVASDGVVTLREAIAAANTNSAVTADVLAGSASEMDIIRFDQAALEAEPGAGDPLRIVLDGSQLEITDDLLIRGPGAEVLTIDAEGGSRVMQVSGSDTEVALTGLTLTGGSTSDDGGGIHVAYGTLTLAHCAVIGNTTTGVYSDGGGIYSYSGALTLTNCTVGANSAIGIQGDGGGIYKGFDGTLTLTNCTVSGNSASGANSSGGGIYNSSDLTATMRNSIVAGNSASGAGDWWGQVDAESSLIGVDPGFVDADGGDYRLVSTSIAINAGDDASLPADVFDLDGDEDTSEPVPVDLRGNPRVADAAVDLGAYEYQGAPDAREAPSSAVTTLDDVVDSTDAEVSLREAMAYSMLGESDDTVTFAPGLAGGTVMLSGAELCVWAPVEILGYGVTVDAGGQSGAFVVAGHDATNVALRNLEITGGNSARSGGGVLNFSTLSLTNCTIRGNVAAGFATQSFGGGIYNWRASTTLTNCAVRANSAAGTDGDGGGIYSHDGALTLTGSTITGNSASMNGGGISKDFYATLTLTNCTVSGNAAGQDGGGVYAPGATTLRNSIVVGNSASGVGDWWGPVEAERSLIGVDPGFVDANGGDYRLASTSIAINAGDNAWLPADEFDLDGDDDTAEPVPVDRDGNPRVADTTVDLGAYEYQGSPDAREAPALVVTTLADVVDSTDGEISLREALACAALGNADETVTFAPCLAGGTAVLAGAELCIYTSVEVDGGVAGVAVDAGGQSGVFWVSGHEGTDVTLRDLEITGGSTARSGGGVLSFAAVSLVNCTVSGNAADSSGGGIHNAYSGALTLTNCRILGNAAGQSGGGVSNDSYNPVTMTNCTIVGNSAGANGGGVHTGHGGTVTLTNCTVSGNSATETYGEGGGICNLHGDTLTLDNTIVALNDASIDFDISGSSIANSSLVGVDPGFVRAPSDGGDGWGDDLSTPGEDESLNDDYGDLRLLETSAAVDAGDNALLPADAFDLDGDANIAEPLPIDLGGNPRVHPDIADIGAYEFGPEPTPAGTLTGVVWRDDNADGVCNGPEPGVEGAGVYLDLDEDGRWDPGETRSLTDGEGVWELTGLQPGEYTVRMIPWGLIVPTSAEASSTFSPTGDPPARMIDASGLTDGLHGTAWTTMWLSAAGDNSPTVTFDLGASYVLTGVHLWNYNQSALTERGFASTDVWISPTGLGDPQSQPGEWTRIADDLAFDEAPGTGDCAAEARALDAGGASARWVHLDDVHAFGATSGAYAGLSEIRFSQEGASLPSSEWEQTYPADAHQANVVDRQITAGVNFGTHPQVLPGDANGDGAVSDADYTIWADHYGTIGATWSTGDFNGDGSVTDADYTVWADNYGAGASAAASATQSVAPASVASTPRDRAKQATRATGSRGRIGAMGPTRVATNARTRASERTLRDDAISASNGEDEVGNLLAILSVAEIL
jgi:parallel beta helix pectate lyase-like protein/SdrD B-like protein